MFNRAPRQLLNDIIELASPSSPKFKPDLYIQGVVNQDPGTADRCNCSIAATDRRERRCFLPAAISERFEVLGARAAQAARTHAMFTARWSHRPLCAKPVVMTVRTTWVRRQAR